MEKSARVAVVTKSVSVAIDDRPMQRQLTCRVFAGLCNRINGIASALATGRPVRLFWAVNKHCPLWFEELFLPFPLVRVSNQVRKSYRRVNGPDSLCWFYPRNVDSMPVDRFRQRLYAAYRQCLEHLRVSNWIRPDTETVGVHFRQYLRGVDNLDHFLNSVERTLNSIQPKAAFVASDNEETKQAIIERIANSGLTLLNNDCQLTDGDLVRTRESVLGLCRDLRSLSLCRYGIITNSTRSTIADACRGFGIKAWYTFDDGVHRHGGRDDLFEMQAVEQLRWQSIRP